MFQIIYKQSSCPSTVSGECERDLRSVDLMNRVRRMQPIQPKVIIHRIFTAWVLKVDARYFLRLIGFARSGGILQVCCLWVGGWIIKDLREQAVEVEK